MGRNFRRSSLRLKEFLSLANDNLGGGPPGRARPPIKTLILTKVPRVMQEYIFMYTGYWRPMVSVHPNANSKLVYKYIKLQILRLSLRLRILCKKQVSTPPFCFAGWGCPSLITRKLIKVKEKARGKRRAEYNLRSTYKYILFCVTIYFIFNLHNFYLAHL